MTKRAIELSGSKLSPTRREVLSHLLPYVADQVFQDPKHKEYWIALIGVESGYNSNAASNKGAVGLGQLLPQFVNDFSAICGMGSATAADARDDFTNAWISACWFRKLLQDYDGSVPMALIAYNAGANGKSIKAAKQGQAPVNKETSDYVAKVWLTTIRNQE